MSVKRYVPTIGPVDWNIKELSKEERAKLKDRLVISLIDNEEDYQTAIGYMYKKYPFEMDGVKAPDTDKRDTAIQWNYAVAKNKAMLKNSVTGKMQDMYAFVVYDKERDMEPVIFAGSYFKLGSANENFKGNEKYLLDKNGNPDPDGKFQNFGVGYVMFCDPDYRRLGLATDLWWAEAQLYREALGIRGQKEIQNSYSLISTQKMFSKPEKCVVTSQGRLKNDGTYAQIRCLLDYEDEDLVEGFNNMLPGLKTIYEKPHWNFLEREGFTKEELIKPWHK